MSCRLPCIFTLQVTYGVSLKKLIMIEVLGRSVFTGVIIDYS
jgi:hypothetical protein